MSAVERAAVLVVDSIDVAYGPAKVLSGISLSLAAGEIVAVIGPNGAGKSTLLRTISGLVRPRSGSIRLDGERIDRLPPHAIVRKGLSHVPEGRGLLAELTVLENLRLGAQARGGMRGAGELDEVYRLFPVLRSRRDQAAGMLSGGEQQMLAIARSLLARPRVLMIDELSLGLAPKIAITLLRLLTGIRERGLSILLVEQNVHQTLTVADRVYLLVNGRVAFEGTPTALRAAPDLMGTYLGTT